MLRDRIKRILKIEKSLVENPSELLADIVFRFYKRFIFKDGKREGVKRREKTIVVIAIMVMMIVLALIVAVSAFVVLECIRIENSIFEFCKCCLKY